MESIVRPRQTVVMIVPLLKQANKKHVFHAVNKGKIGLNTRICLRSQAFCRLAILKSAPKFN